MNNASRLLTLLTALLCAIEACAVLPGYTVDEVIARLDNNGPDHLEGLWRFTAAGQGALVAVERMPDGMFYRLVMVEGPDRSVLPGTIVGMAHAAARAGEYEAELYTDDRGVNSVTGRRKGVRYTLRLSNDGTRFELERHRGRLNTGVSMSIPLLLVRPRVNLGGRAQRTVHGALRVYPADSSPLGPVYL